MQTSEHFSPFHKCKKPPRRHRKFRPAGSANMCSYVAGQHGRNKPFYQDYSFRKEYMSVGNLVHKHAYLDAEA